MTDAPRRAKIVATLGPVTREDYQLRAVLEAGTDVVRFNLAHDDAETHKRVAERVREVAEDLGRVVGVLVDLPGPKMRTGPVENDSVVLEAGDHFVLSADDGVGDSERVSTTVDGLADMVDQGDEIFLADGQIVLEVQAIEGGDVHTKVVRRGLLRSRKGMHVPKAERHVEAFTARDRGALALGLELGADLVGLSFVRDAHDVARVRDMLPAEGRRPLLVAKIETASAVGNIVDIAREADAVMVARGDLGIQTPFKQVPLVQKEIIRACNALGKPVITATQMLESMTHSPLPSRAEVTDIANAIFDGTDAVMLSEETAVGEFPEEAVRTMSDIAVAAEAGVSEAERRAEGVSVGARVSWEGADATESTHWAIAHAAVGVAQGTGADAIVCPTATGSTPRRVAAFRPSMQVIGLSTNDVALGGIAVAWGVTPLRVGRMPEALTSDEGAHRVAELCCEAGIVPRGRLMVVVVGPPAVPTDGVHVVRG